MRCLLIALVVTVMCCGEVTNNKKLPIIGHHDYSKTDTIYYTVGAFSLLNQDSVLVTQDTYKDQITIVDFFFTTCPTICPKMKAQMLRVYEKIKNDEDITILSHTIDPEYDSVAVLKKFSENLGVTNDNWQFLTGAKDSLYALAQTYLVLADEDSEAPGGFIHSGAFILVDKDRRIRSVWDGTDEKQVTLFMKDIDLLRKEYE